MPRSTTEPIPDEEGSDRDGDGESDEGANGTDRKDGANGDLAGKDEEYAATANEDIEPDGVDRRLCRFVDAGPITGKREAAITGVGEGYTGCGDHASLTHGESGNDSKAEAGEGRILAETLQKEGGPRLTEVRIDDRFDVDDHVGGYKLKKPAKNPANTRGQDDGAG